MSVRPCHMSPTHCHLPMATGPSAGTQELPAQLLLLSTAFAVGGPNAVLLPALGRRRFSWLQLCQDQPHTKCQGTTEPCFCLAMLQRRPTEKMEGR